MRTSPFSHLGVVRWKWSIFMKLVKLLHKVAIVKVNRVVTKPRISAQ
jgi:hypothetical protein